LILTYANKKNKLSPKFSDVTCRDWELENRFRRVKSFATFRLMSLKRICEAGSETWQLNTATTRSQPGR